MISFACQQIDLREIVQCSFDLNKREYELLIYFLKKEEPKAVNEVAEETGFERSTIQKAISNLLRKELVQRRQINLKGGGYKYYYNIINKEELKKRLKDIVSKWYRNVEEAINKW